ncbi:hypothetical protein SAMN04489724_2296 [Algoriphagus locisalis]|uniref:Uncharacterized protein n=1 Tax=Algoriphagus locisalis TaxID=305507 RepID=A0A1I7BCI4_9BACT|nr:hypothetical protein [Algoriphagus locisalis]SFT84906.1 hypothetical protein SAMN04489724_2296 [Algoriphagus locisalis]
MSKHKLTILWAIFLAALIGVLVYWFFERKERVINENIQQLESASGISGITHTSQIQVIDESPEIGTEDIPSAGSSLSGILSISKKGILRAKIQKV